MSEKKGGHWFTYLLLIAFGAFLMFVILSVQGCATNLSKVPQKAKSFALDARIDNDLLKRGRRVGLGNTFKHGNRIYVVQRGSGSDPEHARSICMEKALISLGETRGDQTFFATIKSFLRGGGETEHFTNITNGEVHTCECLLSIPSE